MRPFALLLIALALSAAPASSAQPVFEWITRADGLPSDYVLGVYQDRWGFLWFGTDAGAVRWDGSRGRTFSVDDGLPHSYVDGFAETPDGTLWAATNGGLARRTPEGWETVLDSPLSPEPIGRLEVDAEGQLLVTQRALLARREGDTWRTFHWPDGLGHQSAPVLDLGDGRLLASGFRQPEALLLTPDGTDRFRGEPLPVEGLDALSPGTYLSIYRAGERMVGLVGEGRILLHLQLDLDTPRLVVERRMPTAFTSSLLLGNEKVYGYSSSSGESLHQLDIETGSFGPSMTRAKVTHAVFDREGGLWVGTFGKGVARLRSTHLLALTETPGRRVALAGNDAWVTGNEGIVRVSIDRDEVEVRRIPLSSARKASVLSDGRVRLSMQASLWPPLPSRALERIRSLLPISNDAVDSGWISDSAETADTLWMGTYANGIRRFLKSQNGLTELDTLTVPQGLPTETVEDIQRTTSGVWALTRSGLGLVHGGRARALTADDGLPSAAVYSLYEAQDGSHWAGTNRGIARLDLSGWRADVVGEETMGGHPVVALFERTAAPGVLWAVTTRGLWRIEGDEMRPMDGFPLVRDRRDTIEHAAYHEPSDQLVLATTGGTLLANLNALPEASLLPPPIALVGVRVNDADVELRGASREAHLPDLPPGPHRVEIEAAALLFSGTARLEWRGPRGTWSDAPGGRVVLSNVGAGEHAVEMRAVAPGGVPSAETALLTFSVAPRWWERSLVRALLGLVGLAMLIGGVRYASQRRLRTRVRELEVVARVHAERERISRDLHDHVGAEVAAILTEAEVARLEAAASGRDTTAFQTVERRARRTMGSLREAIWALGLGALTPATLAERLEAFAQTQARHVGLGVDSQATGDAHRALTPDQALALYRIGQEAVRNAVRHSGASRLHITVEAGRGRVAVVVRDDGVFEGLSGDGGGYGLANMRTRAEALGGTFALTNGDGTTVRADIPLADG